MLQGILLKIHCLLEHIERIFKNVRSVIKCVYIGLIFRRITDCYWNWTVAERFKHQTVNLGNVGSNPIGPAELELY